jgi:hypothetical protein
MPSRSNVWSVGKAPILKFHMCMFRLSYASRFCKALNNGVLHPLQQELAWSKDSL